MGIKVQISFIAKATVIVRAYVTNDETDALENPSVITCTILDPDGEIKETGAMTLITTGTYDYYFYTTTATEKGQWRGEVLVTDGVGETAKITPVPFAFTIN